MIKQNSLEAYRCLDVSRSERAVLDAIRTFPGITRQEVCRMIGMPINGVFGRVSGLLSKGLVVEGANTTNGKTGRGNATLWPNEDTSISKEE